MSVYYELHEGNIRIKGKTYPYRELIRSLGGLYESVEKTWRLPNSPENLAKVSELCKSIGGGQVKEKPLPAPTPMETALAAPELPQTAVTGSDGYTIAELMQKTQLAIAAAFPRSIWVVGELQNLRWHQSGCFFQLADFKEGGSKSATVTVNATIWASQMRDIERRLGPDVKGLLQDGVKLRVLADVSFFKDRGQISLQIQSLDPNYTKGSLALAREKLLRDMRAKGLDRLQKSLKLTAFPLHIGLLSAEDSRAKSDFIDQLKVYGFPGQVHFIPTQMQGENTLRDVVNGIAALVEIQCDVIVLTRGGGSAADLRWFDSPEIAYAVAQAKIPIVAAIGHHEDVCVAEELCYQREKTPTAAADFILSVLQKTRERIEILSQHMSRQLTDRVKLFDASLQQVTERMRASLQNRLHELGRGLDQLAGSLDLQWQRRLLQSSAQIESLQEAMRQQLSLRDSQERGRLAQLADALHARAEIPRMRVAARLEDLTQRLRTASDQALQQATQQLLLREAALKQRDPQPWMREGWTQLFDKQGLIRSGAALQKGQAVRARLPDALIELEVTHIQNSEPRNEGTR